MQTLKSINDLKRHTQAIQAELDAAVARVLHSGWFVLGPEVAAFENEFASYCGTGHCVSLANGTDALELALRALNIGAGKNVLTVANAGMYSTAAILAAGARPVFADVHSDTLLMDSAEVARVLEQQKIDAIIVTHLYGLLADIGKLVELARDYGIPVIEDCAQAHGAGLKQQKTGSFGDIACFSFYPTKNLGALGDGGAIVTSQPELAAKVRQLRQYGWSSKYHAAVPGGRNSRLDEMQAAVLRVMLPLLDQWNARRREIAARYSEGISHPKVNVPPVHGTEYVAHLYVIRTPERDRLKQHLSDAAIPSDVHYPVPDYAQAACRDLCDRVNLPVTAQACNEVLTLPCFPEMRDDEVDSIIACVNSW
ncbi:MAG TPA: DegT/DnrJ/EryC1/StrS family aminotransferase [Gallionella sp.]|nr:DegT/DnrJ/EryC1/StrS family aminotransferase [Gallionella sp.]